MARTDEDLAAAVASQVDSELRLRLAMIEHRADFLRRTAPRDDGTEYRPLRLGETRAEQIARLEREAEVLRSRLP